MYTITDVPELAGWMKSKVAAHPSFRPLTAEELEADVAAGFLITSSEEGQKVERNLGQVSCCFRHQVWRANPALMADFCSILQTRC